MFVLPALATPFALHLFFMAFHTQTDARHAFVLSLQMSIVAWRCEEAVQAWHRRVNTFENLPLNIERWSRGLSIEMVSLRLLFSAPILTQH